MTKNRILPSRKIFAFFLPRNRKSKICHFCHRKRHCTTLHDSKMCRVVQCANRREEYDRKRQSYLLEP
jgi:hypothetical protein